ncbi:hypothetical protein C8R44DRAFT_541651, partial [Mycena epipterygia]
FLLAKLHIDSLATKLTVKGVRDALNSLPQNLSGAFNELKVALSVEEGAPDLNVENILDMGTILSVCAGLVIINKEDNKVRLIHYTIQDYLKRIQGQEFPRAHSKIT